MYNYYFIARDSNASHDRLCLGALSHFFPFVFTLGRTSLFYRSVGCIILSVLICADCFMSPFNFTPYCNEISIRFFMYFSSVHCHRVNLCNCNYWRLVYLLGYGILWIIQGFYLYIWAFPATLISVIICFNLFYYFDCLWKHCLESKRKTSLVVFKFHENISS